MAQGGRRDTSGPAASAHPRRRRAHRARLAALVVRLLRERTGMAAPRVEARPTVHQRRRMRPREGWAKSVSPQVQEGDNPVGGTRGLTTLRPSFAFLLKRRSSLPEPAW